MHSITKGRGKNMKKQTIFTILTLIIFLGLGNIGINTAFASNTVTAAPCKTKVTVDGKAKTFEAYTIKEEDYYKLIDLAYVFKGTIDEFGFKKDELHDALLIETGEQTSDLCTNLKTAMAKGDGKNKSATLVSPKVYFNTTEKNFTVYRINGDDYYKLSEIMDLINCGVIKNKKTGVVNFDTTKYYEPEFASIPKGDANYRKVQQLLYDAYFNKVGGEYAGGKDDCYVGTAKAITVPDNATLYVPRGVTFEPNKIYLGNNSNFVVRGTWIVEYADAALKPVSAKTKNALYFHGNKGFSPDETEMMQNYEPEVIRVDGNKYDRIVPALKSASVSYGSTINGIQQLKLNFARDKRDTYKGLYVTIHVKDGTSYSLYSKDVEKAMDLMPLLANAIGKNIGKKVTIDKIVLQNANYSSWFGKVIKSETYTLAVNWTINTSKTALKVESQVVFQDHWAFTGLSKNTYIVKYYKGVYLDSSTKKIDYTLLSPENDYSLAPISFKEEMVLGDRANIGTLTGKKGKGKNNYIFAVSPLSNAIMFALNCDYYPQNASLITENDKTYLKFEVINSSGEKTSNNFDNIIIKYHKKGAAADSLQQLYLADTDLRTGKLDLTESLTALNNKKGTTNIDKLYIYMAGYEETSSTYIPSLQYAEVSCDITTQP